MKNLITMSNLTFTKKKCNCGLQLKTKKKLVKLTKKNKLKNKLKI
jgi:hypothetical protein